MILRVQLCKGEDARFISHLGFMRAIERAIRRAGIPIAYSEGYHPHPKMSLAIALGVGLTSEAEYVDIELGSDMPVADALKALADSMPPGISAVSACSVDGKAALAASVEYASYRASGATPEAAAAFACGAREFMARGSSIARIKTKSGEREADIRPLVREIRAGAELDFTCACGGRAHLRPLDLIAHLGEIAGAVWDLGGCRISRTGLYFTEGDALVSPMCARCRDYVMAGGPIPRS
ncbi:MAG: TIGR03936 family radical SAM-associated protein [Clostridia bacterium]|nr:TIGR03936 family radical SAM-associated protein [Clostridia bacterium]